MFCKIPDPQQTFVIIHTDKIDLRRYHIPVCKTQSSRIKYRTDPEKEQRYQSRKDKNTSCKTLLSIVFFLFEYLYLAIS